jgi:hypothetical protein
MLTQILLAFAILTGTVLFVTGLHGIDNAWNMKYMNHMTGDEFIDFTLAGDGKTADAVYGQSVLLCMAGFFATMLAALYFNGEGLKRS